MPSPTPIQDATIQLARRYLRSGSGSDYVASLIALHTPGIDPEVARLTAEALAGDNRRQAAENLVQAAIALGPL